MMVVYLHLDRLILVELDEVKRCRSGETEIQRYGRQEALAWRKGVRYCIGSVPWGVL